MNCVCIIYTHIKSQCELSATPKAAGISWWSYQRFMKSHEKPIEEEKLIKVPATLDLTPYRDEKDFGLLQRLVRKEKQNRR